MHHVHTTFHTDNTQTHRQILSGQRNVRRGHITAWTTTNATGQGCPGKWASKRLQ